jgi:hypothetical protein
MVVPLSRVTTQSKGILEAPNRLILIDRPQRTGLQTGLSKVVVEWLQRRFDALLQAGTL